MPFPFLFLASALIAGILTADSLAPSAPVYLAGMIGSLLISWTCYLGQRHKAAFFSLITAVLFFGIAHASFWNTAYETNPLRRLTLEDYADFYGTVAKSPFHEIERDVFIIKVERLAARGREDRLRGNLRLTVPRTAEMAPLQDLFAGDRVKVSAKLSVSKDFNNFNAPFFARYLKSRNIHNRAFTKSPLLVEKIAPAGKSSPFHALSRLRQNLEKRIERFFSRPLPSGISPQGAVLDALLLGNDGRLDSDTESALQKSGLYHLFAISGAHVAIISFLFFSFLKLIRIPRRASLGILAGGLVFYALLVEGSPSVLRAVIMALALLLGKLFWKDVRLLNTLSISAFVLLIANPFSLFDAGFQLTFAATLSIVLFYPKIIKRFPRLPFRIGELLAVSAAAVIGVLPIVAGDFNRVTFSSVILNVAAVPLIGVIMALGYVFLPLSFVLPLAARSLAIILESLILFFFRLSRLLDPIPFLSYRIPTPPGLVQTGFYVFLLLLLVPKKFKGQKTLVSTGLAACFLLLVTYPFPAGSPDLKVTVLDVGQGDSIFVQFPGKRTMLIDGGGFPQGSFDVGERVVSSFLWNKGIKRIDILVLTHPHPDHFNGLPSVARNFRIGEFWEAKNSVDSQPLRIFRNHLDSGIRRRTIGRGFVRKEDSVLIEILHPGQAMDSNGRPDLNDLSLVLKLTYGNVAFLLTGDIGRQAEAEILEACADLKSRVLKSPHHGSDSSSSAAFLEKVSPEYVAISAGEGNPYGFPQAAVLERYDDVGAEILRTDVHGAVEFSTNGRTLRVRTASATIRKD